MLTDKQVVKAILKDFLKISSYTGYTDGIDPHKLTQTIRRVCKSPTEMDIDELLDFCLILAIQNANFEAFDAKSRVFVDQTLDLISSSFKGFTKVEHVTKDADGEEQTITLNSFPSFESENKTFNKVMIHKNMLYKFTKWQMLAPNYLDSFLYTKNSQKYIEKKFLAKLRK